MNYRRFVFFHPDFTFILMLLLYSNLSVRTLPRQDSLTYLLLFIVFNQHSQAGIEGICQTRYVIQDDSKNSRATISKSKDLTDCQEKAVKNTGMAYIRPCPTCPLVRAAWSPPATGRHEPLPNTPALHGCQQGAWLACAQLTTARSYL